MEISREKQSIILHSEVLSSRIKIFLNNYSIESFNTVDSEQTRFLFLEGSFARIQERQFESRYEALV